MQDIKPMQEITFTSKRKITSILLLIVISLGLSACSLPGMHKIDIQQGNYIDPQRVERLEVGMSKKEVQLIMGTPILQDPYHPDTWIYAYSFHKIGSEEQEKNKLVIYFEDDKMTRFEQQ